MGNGWIEFKLARVDKGELGTGFLSPKLMAGADQGPGHVQSGLLQLWGVVIKG